MISTELSHHQMDDKKGDELKSLFSQDELPLSEILTQLEQQQVDPNQVIDKLANRPLHLLLKYALETNDSAEIDLLLKIVEKLILQGASITLTNIEELTPEDLALKLLHDSSANEDKQAIANLCLTKLSPKIDFQNPNSSHSKLSNLPIKRSASASATPKPSARVPFWRSLPRTLSNRTLRNTGSDPDPESGARIFKPK